MSETRRNLLVGGFVLVGLVALGMLIVLFGQGPTWLVRGDTYTLHIRFEQVSGIRPGNMVTVRGISIGRVTDVQLIDPSDFEAGVDVEVAIDMPYRIPIGSRAQTTEPVLGQGRPPIEIIAAAPTETWLEPGATISGTVRGAIDSIFPPGVVSTFQDAARRIGDAAAALTPVLEETRELLARRELSEVDQQGLPGNLSTAVARFDDTLRHFNEVLGDPQVKSQVRETVANLHLMSERGTHVMTTIEDAATNTRDLVKDGRQLIARAGDTLENIDGSVQTLSRRTTGTLDKVDTTLDPLRIIGNQVASGEGTIGQLVMNNDLYEALVISGERLSAALSDLRALVAEWREGKIRVGL